MVRFASIAAAAGAAALATCGPARAASDITLAAIATGRLYVVGTTDHPRAPVVLEDQFRTESDDKGKFQYELVYYPSRCIVSASIDGKSVEAVVSNCSQQCQIGPRNTPASPAASAVSGPLPAMLSLGVPPVAAGLAPAVPPARHHSRAAVSTPPARIGAASVDKPALPAPVVPKPVQVERPPVPPQRPAVKALPQARAAQPPKPVRKPRPAVREAPDDAGPPIAD